MNSTQIEKILKWVLYIGLFSIPFIALVTSRELFFPYISSKGFLFRVMIEILLGVWVVLAYKNAEYRPKFSWVLGAFAFFLGITILADFFGENPYRSFWSNYERMEGLVLHLHLFAYLLIVTSTLRTEKLWLTFLNTSVGVSAVVGVYGLAQLAGSIPINQGGVRLDGTFGNASYLAVYVLLHAFLAMFLWSNARDKFWAKWVYGAVALLNLFILYHTATRGAILGLIVGVFVTSLLLALFEKENARTRKIAVGVLLAMVLVPALFFGLRNASFIQESPVLNRFSSISLDEATTKSRFMIWNMSWQGFKEHPILGWGQENYNLVFNKYYNPKMYGQEPWFDRAHNVVFDWLIVGGILGLLAYIGLFKAVVFSLWSTDKESRWGIVRRVKGWFGSSPEVFTLTEKSILTGLLAGYFFQNLFVFDNLLSYIMFFTMAGFVHVMTTLHKKPLLAEQETSSESTQIVGALALAGVVLLVYFFNANAYLANRTLIGALSPHEEGLSTNLDFFKKSLAYNSFGDAEIREQLAQAATRVNQLNSDQGLKQEFNSLAREEMVKQAEIAPNDARYQSFTGVLLSRTGQSEEALKYVDRALALSPHKQNILFEKVNGLINLKKYEEALEIAKFTYELEPEYDQARRVYALSALYSGDVELSESLMSAEYGRKIELDNNFLQAYNELGQHEKVIDIWLKRIAENPEDPQARLSLAYSYLQDNQRDKAIVEIQKVIALQPEFKQQGEYYITEIRAGRNP